MLKKTGKILGVALLVIVVVIGVFFVRYQMMASNVIAQYRQIKTVDLSRVADGVYSGSFGDFLVYVKVEVTVKRRVIASIKVVDQRSGPGYEALATVDRIIKAQSPKVDAVTGASGSSMSIMIAVNRALTCGK
ncbi:hypothetical protein A3K48_01805 [candidate division WOR-1 bacterium RIFOXYA12_FULL_52_29]|uniref:FMN-binding domain-containing protein n=1 Tax=candidate division WOR-1 bacterium RIFOXYC12_FULL_54_18 TaxID=1802584 RepID=A0A1F4T4U0_UNCSA|nr:MAG: hypothetical protein A3K44_01805 [candidate division WOR-1 bacterium RIFOXYA2_FULL_51_19]OGC17317.1 MAG: hypothetical protein A3K48_01805 [candidate division WOR-1 bacterium RIFOXYA12_FULL_52_29]OGC26177.1 MAG: hypothetical protein A3K32_01800 [candidate division WOR-1 bacterium RIFOXYB2_FULL_45_9]OGC27734.1 MAG: hypothetical protein A3K49_01805 [candidate division WOR-1 bacterium RIFOXYC12_FULL_54_18]OGC29975.1 MAG: hypothetical protein A2346_04530 [candidate division WOR-1 bacterium R